MTMKKVILLSSVLLAVPFMMNGEALAADCVTQDCPTLGYSSLSNSGNCVKCPFGNFWACPKNNTSNGGSSSGGGITLVNRYEKSAGCECIKFTGNSFYTPYGKVTIVSEYSDGSQQTSSAGYYFDEGIFSHSKDEISFSTENACYNWLDANYASRCRKGATL